MMDDKEQAWLRLKAFELADGYRHPEKDATMNTRLLAADHLYHWAVTGQAPGSAASD